MELARFCTSSSALHGACPSGRKNLFTGGGGVWTSSSALQALGPAKSLQSGRTCSRGGGGCVDKFFRSQGFGACKEPSERRTCSQRGGRAWTNSSALQALNLQRALQSGRTGGVDEFFRSPGSGPAKSFQSRRTCSQEGGGGQVLPLSRLWGLQRALRKNLFTGGAGGGRGQVLPL